MIHSNQPFAGTWNTAKSYTHLLCNPGFAYPQVSYSLHTSLDHERLIIKNLRHQNGDEKYPFYFLDPLSEKHGGFTWWSRTFDRLVQELKVERLQTARHFFCVELYGYHSEFGDANLFNQLPSVEYTKLLVRNAIRKRKLILICRGIRKWFTLVPDLAKYDNCFFVSSNRGITLSQCTISPRAYVQIKQILTER